MESHWKNYNTEEGPFPPLSAYIFIRFIIELLSSSLGTKPAFLNTNWVNF